MKIQQPLLHHHLILTLVVVDKFGVQAPVVQVVGARCRLVRLQLLLLLLQQHLVLDLINNQTLVTRPATLALAPMVVLGEAMAVLMAVL